MDSAWQRSIVAAERGDAARSAARRVMIVVVDEMRWVSIGAIVIAGCGPSVPFDPASETSTSMSSEPVDDDGDHDDGSPTTVMTTPATSVDEGPSPTSTSTSTTEGDSVDESSEEVTFIDDPGGQCFTHCSVECDLWAQDCVDGEKCMPWANDGGSEWNANRCSPIAEPSGAPGDPCFVEGSAWSGIDDCQISAMCWEVDADTNAGTCAAFCGNSEAHPVCEGDTACMMAYDGHLLLCLPACDPLAPACAAGHACVESYAQAQGIGDVFACVPESLVADRSLYADPCDDVIGCGTGLWCTVAEDVPSCGSDCCTTLCDPLAANTCPDAAAGQVCVAHEDTPTLGHCGFE